MSPLIDIDSFLSLLAVNWFSFKQIKTIHATNRFYSLFLMLFMSRIKSKLSVDIITLTFNSIIINFIVSSTLWNYSTSLNNRNIQILDNTWWIFEFLNLAECHQNNTSLFVLRNDACSSFLYCLFVICLQTITFNL